MRYRDAAVITGDLPSYGRELAHQFDEAGIPYFLDDKKSILENPMVELIRAALEMVKDFSYESAFRYLKQDWCMRRLGAQRRGRRQIQRSGRRQIQRRERRQIQRQIRPGMQGKQMLRADLTVPGNMQSR